MNNELDMNAVQKRLFLLSASARLGISPEKLKEKLENGEIKAAIEKSGQLGELNRIIKDKAALEKLLNNDSVKELIRKMKEGK